MKLLLAALLFSTVVSASTRLINGTPVKPGEWEPVVNIVTGNSMCSATVIGPKVVITAGHCVGNGTTSKFSLKGKSYQGVATRSPIYPGQDHDVAFIKLTAEVDVKPVTVYGGEKLKNGDTLHLLGFGCTQPGGGGGNDGVLREGDSTVIGFTGYDIVSRKSNGAALCFGDSGGPGMVQVNGKWQIVSINSKGNIKDTNYTTDLVHAESKKFFDSYVAKEGVEICGINKDCDGPAPESFEMENDAVKLSVTNKGMHDVEFVKNAFKMTMWYLDSDVPPPLKHTGPPPAGACSCGLGFIAVCDGRGVGRCGSYQCECDE